MPYIKNMNNAITLWFAGKTIKITVGNFGMVRSATRRQIMSNDAALTLAAELQKYGWKRI